MKFVQKEVGNENNFQNPLKNWKRKSFLVSFSLSSIYIISYFIYKCLDVLRNSLKIHNCRRQLVFFSGSSTKNTQLHATFDQFLIEILPLDSCKLYAIFR